MKDYPCTFVNPVRDLCQRQSIRLKRIISKGVRPVRWLFSNGANIIYPLKCQICGERKTETETPLCPDCRNRIKKNEPPFCLKCGRFLPASRQGRHASRQGRPAPTQESCCVCRECQRKNFYFQRAWSATIYEGVIRKCVHLIKFKGKKLLIKPLSKILVDFSKSFLDIRRFGFLIPVPLDRKKKWEREFNQASLLMETLAKEFHVPCIRNNLVKVRSTAAQSSLSQQQRLVNLEGAFRIRRPREVVNKTILLIDDVFTTGTTSSECARILMDNGAKHIEVLTLARGQS